MKTTTYIFNVIIVFAALAFGAFLWTRAASPLTPEYPKNALVIRAQ